MPGLWDEAPRPEPAPVEPKPPEMVTGASLSGPAAGPRVLSVGDLTRLIRDTIRGAPRLARVWVEGEVGQVTVSSAGHCYFTLKDERAQLRCMIFRDDRLALPLEPRTGLRVIANGRLDVFEPQGAYQLYVESLQPAGVGDLALRFEALKARLTAEGLFDTRRKRPLPRWPRSIGIVTSLSGAVLHDVHRVIGPALAAGAHRREPLPGAGRPGAAASIVRALHRLGRWTDPVTGLAVDVVIVARGGGSLEDLWAFNDERVVRAVAAHPRPVVVGVGPRDGRDARGVRGRCPGRHAVGRGRARRCRTAPSSASASARCEAALATSVGPPMASTARRPGGRAAEPGAVRPGRLLAAERERVGLLLDRATRAVRSPPGLPTTPSWPAGRPAAAARRALVRPGTGHLHARAPAWPR